MPRTRTLEQPWNPWKITTLGLIGVVATALITGVVVANYTGNQQAESPPAPPPPQQYARQAEPASRPQAPARPAAADVEACNQRASAVAHDRTKETLTDALIGGALGAGVGAIGGAIAHGGDGAGKGAGIGGLLGVTAGTLYGLNQSNQQDARATAAYRACMKRRGFVD